MLKKLTVDGLEITVCRKKMKNIYLRIQEGTGEIKISAPWGVRDEDLVALARRKMEWIQRSRADILKKSADSNYTLADGTKCVLWGQFQFVHIHENMPECRIIHSWPHIHIHLKGTSREGKAREIFEMWEKEIFMEKAADMVEAWRKQLNIAPIALNLRKMKSRWGSCAPAKRKITLNRELARKPVECLEYIIVHELMHFFEQNHGPAFKKLMDSHLPQWRRLRKRLNEPFTEAVSPTS